MANRNTQGFGLIPAGRMGGTPSIQGQGKYFIDAGHSTTIYNGECCLLYTSPSPRDLYRSRMPSSA